MQKIRLKPAELRTQQPDPAIMRGIKRNQITIVLEDVLDTYNVGAIFRLADAVAAEKVYLCGQTETPPNPKIKKASVNTWQWIDWEYAEKVHDVLLKLKTQNSKLKIIVVEQDEKSIPLEKLTVNFPVVVVVGNETYGVSKEVLDMADTVIELPMYGINTSLNVMVSCGIVLYAIIGHLQKE